jgi:transposase
VGQTVLGVHVENVRLWVRTHRAGGDAALAGTPHPGRPRFLTPDQEAEVRGWLAQRPTAFGFRTNLWTAARVANLICDRLTAHERQSTCFTVRSVSER